MERESIIKILKRAVGGQCCHETADEYEILRNDWKTIFTSLNPEGSLTEDEDRHRIDFIKMEDDLLDLLNGIWKLKTKHMMLENETRRLIHMLENETIANPPPQYVENTPQLPEVGADDVN